MEHVLKQFALDLPAQAVAARLAQEVCGLCCEPAFPTAVSLVPWKLLQSCANLFTRLLSLKIHMVREGWKEVG